MKFKSVVRVVVSSPKDVRAERDAVSRVAELLNTSILSERNVLIEVVQWEKNAKPGFHPDGRQSGIDDSLQIEDADLFIGIFWKRYGTAVHDGKSGTEHEYSIAYESWKKQRRPEIFFYFRSISRKDQAGKDQWRRVRAFQEQFPGEGLWWQYKSLQEFERLLTRHLFEFIKERVPLDASIPIAEPALAGDSRCDAAVEQSSHRKAFLPVITESPFAFARPDLVAHPWRMALACSITLLFVVAGYWVWYSSNLRHMELAEAVEHETDPHAITMPLMPAGVLRGESSTEVSQLPQSSGRVRLKLIFPHCQDFEVYDLTLIEARNDRVLSILRRLTCKNQTIIFDLNQHGLPAATYRLIVSREGELVGMYFFRR